MPGDLVEFFSTQNLVDVHILKYSSPIPQASELACRLNTVGISDP